MECQFFQNFIQQKAIVNLLYFLCSCEWMKSCTMLFSFVLCVFGVLCVKVSIYIFYSIYIFGARIFPIFYYYHDYKYKTSEYLSLCMLAALTTNTFHMFVYALFRTYSRCDIWIFSTSHLKFCCSTGKYVWCSIKSFYIFSYIRVIYIELV